MSAIPVQYFSLAILIVNAVQLLVLLWRRK